MIPRYTPADFAELWSSRRRYATWFDVEIAACEAMETAGVVPNGTSAQLAPCRARLDAARIEAIEKETRHDVIAFLTHVEELGGAPARWLHRGMTSSDVLDTSLALLLVEATDKLSERCRRLLSALRQRATEHRRTPAIGRSHGIHAEPLTFGLVLAGHAAELQRAHDRLQAARREIAVGKIAGAVGTYAHLTPGIEQQALASLGLRAETVATQIVARDRHAAWSMSLALLAAAIERLATNVRHWQRSEVREAEESFAQGQKGSSAMPHKRNPILSENLCGLARVVRAAVVPALENIALWHERDISHSSVERMMLPDASSTLAFMLDRSIGLVEQLHIDAERLQANLQSSGGLWASEGVMLALVGKGLPRQAAYELVQRNAMRAYQGEASFEQLLLDDEELRAQLSESEIRQQLNLQHALRHVEAIVERECDAGQP